jgi:hypothetical protein
MKLFQTLAAVFIVSSSAFAAEQRIQISQGSEIIVNAGSPVDTYVSCTPSAGSPSVGRVDERMCVCEWAKNDRHGLSEYWLKVTIFRRGPEDRVISLDYFTGSNAKINCENVRNSDQRCK